MTKAAPYQCMNVDEQPEKGEGQASFYLDFEKLCVENGVRFSCSRIVIGLVYDTSIVYSATVDDRAHRYTSASGSMYTNVECRGILIFHRPILWCRGPPLRGGCMAYIEAKVSEQTSSFRVEYVLCVRPIRHKTSDF